jgi:hypothetical protein
MIDSIEEYKKFVETNCGDDLFLHLVLWDDREHSCQSSPCILFVQNFDTEELYHLNFTHQDCSYVVDIHQLIKDLNTFAGRLFVLDKKSFIQHIPLSSIVDLILGIHLSSDKVITLLDFETNAHRFIKHKFYSYPLLNKVVPLMKHREMVNNIFLKIKKYRGKSIFHEKFFKRINTEIVESLSEIESHGIYVNKECFKKYFDATVSPEGFVYSQYNLLTSTGRPSNRFGGVNYAALNKDDGSRECFVSRFGSDGMMSMIDYSSFHPRIICELTKFNLPLTVDFYSYLAKLCFKKSDLDQHDLEDIKTLTFRQLYGGVEEKYSHIQYFYNLKNFIDTHWAQFIDVGFVTTPNFGRKITTDQIQDPNPNKLFNYILQATETEIAVPILGKVNEFLRNHKSKAVLYTYDSLLFDVHKDELNLITNDVVELMTNNRFPIKLYMGESYASLKQVSL